MAVGRICTQLPEHLRTKKIGRATLHVDVLLGRVAAEKKWSETHVWGGGGGGYVGKHGGQLNQVHIGSTVDLNQEIWLDLPDGSPHCLQVTNMNVQALEGHPLSVVEVRGARYGGIGAVCNLMTGAHFDDAALCLHLARAEASSPWTKPALSLAAVAVASATIWSGMWLIGFLSLFPGLALARAIAQGQSEDQAQLIRRHLALVQKWVVEELTFSVNAAAATVVDVDDAPQPEVGLIAGK